MAENSGEQKDFGNQVQVSLKFPVFRYVSAVKRILSEGKDTAELSGIGNAVTPVVSAIEILKKQGMVEIVKIETGLHSVPTNTGPDAQVPRLAVEVKKSSEFDKLYAEQQAAAEEKRKAREAAEGQKETTE